MSTLAATDDSSDNRRLCANHSAGRGGAGLRGRIYVNGGNYRGDNAGVIAINLQVTSTAAITIAARAASCRGLKAIKPIGDARDFSKTGLGEV